MLETIVLSPCFFKHIKRGKYFRLLADMYGDGQSLAEALIRAKHGRVYAGGE